VSAVSTLKYLYLSLLSSPKEERQLCRAVSRLKAKRILEVGVQQGTRADRLLQVARCFHERNAIHYVGIDLFETRPVEQPGLTLKQAHQRLRPLAGKIHLLPGDPFSAFERVVNHMAATDLVVVSADQDRESLQRAWFYVPRILHDTSEVFLAEEAQEEGRVRYHRLSRLEILSLAKKAGGVRRRAA
jgi:hypothetical protein